MIGETPAVGQVTESPESPASCVRDGAAGPVAVPGAAPGAGLQPAPHDEVGQREEYARLYAEMAESKRYVFERPVLIAAAGAAALGAFRDHERYLAALPFLIVGLLLFNLRLTANRIRSGARIVAYIQLQLEERRFRPWQGWETSLRAYRRWLKRKDARRIVDREFDRESVADSVWYYREILALHLAIAAITVGAGALGARDALSAPFPLVCGIATLALAAALLVSAVKDRPGRLRTAIERNRVIWMHALAEISPAEEKVMPKIVVAPEVQPESIRLAMDEAWRDHHHARDQTWKAVQMEALIAAGLVGVDAQHHSVIATTVLATLVALVAVFGIWISLHHRKVEIRKITHILHCEEALGLHRPDLIGDVSPPAPLRLRDAWRPSARNTATFILRVHLAILVFALVVAGARWVEAASNPAAPVAPARVPAAAHTTAPATVPGSAPAAPVPAGVSPTSTSRPRASHP